MEPTELTAAVIAGQATTWMLTLLTIHAIPAVMLGLIVMSTTIGCYRRRWAKPIA